MFNVTGGELFMILVVALIVLGPERLPTAARRIGQVVGQLRDLSEGFKREVAQALDDPGEPIVKPMSRPRLTALAGGAAGERADTAPADTAAAAPEAGSPLPATAESGSPRPGDTAPPVAGGERPPAVAAAPSPTVAEEHSPAVADTPVADTPSAPVAEEHSPAVADAPPADAGEQRPAVTDGTGGLLRPAFTYSAPAFDEPVADPAGAPTISGGEPAPPANPAEPAADVPAHQPDADVSGPAANEATGGSGWVAT